MELSNSYVESVLRKLTTQIVVPLRHKNVDVEAFSKLFELLDEIIPVINDEDTISRKAVGLLFFIYTQLETQLSYANRSKDDPIRQIKARLLNYLRKVFGDVKEN